MNEAQPVVLQLWSLLPNLSNDSVQPLSHVYAPPNLLFDIAHGVLLSHMQSQIRYALREAYDKSFRGRLSFRALCLRQYIGGALLPFDFLAELGLLGCHER